MRYNALALGFVFWPLLLFVQTGVAPAAADSYIPTYRRRRR